MSATRHTTSNVQKKINDYYCQIVWNKHERTVFERKVQNQYALECRIFESAKHCFEGLY